MRSTYQTKKNRFAALEQKNDDNKYNQEIVSVVNDSELKVAKCMKTAIPNKILKAIKVMLKKRCEMKQDKLKYGNIEYVELCKTVKKNASRNKGLQRPNNRTSLGRK